MNLARLDSSRQAASFEPKIFENLKIYFFCEFRKNFYLKRSSLTRGIQRCKIHCRRLLNNGAMAVKILKFQTAITPLLSDLER
jgi:hypothetical protein